MGLVWVLLLLGMGAFMGPAMAQLTAGQSVPPALNVGENAMVTVALTNYGSDATQAIITPVLPAGIETSNPEGQTAQLYPGITAPISYPIRAIQCGNYIIASDVSYSEDGTWRNLRLLSDLTVIGQTMPMQPGQMAPSGIAPPGVGPQGINGSESYPPGFAPMNQSGLMANSTMPISPDGYSASYPEGAPDSHDHNPSRMYEQEDRYEQEDEDRPNR